MENVTAENAQDRQAARKWLEPVVALLMALATVGTAWCSYESAVWTRHSGAENKLYTPDDKNAILKNIKERQAARIQGGIFIQGPATKHSKNKPLAHAYVKLFPPNLQKV